MSTNSFDRSASDRLIPAAVSEKISHVVKRTQGTRRLSGSLIALAAALFVMLIAICVDWALVLYEPAQRAQLTSVSLTFMAFLAASAFGFMALRRISIMDVARRIDEQVPVLQERWTSITEFSLSNAVPEVRGSEVFIRKVAEEAAQMEHMVKPEKIQTGKQLHFATAVLVAIIGLWAVALWNDPGRTTILVRRFLSPYSNISLTRIQSESGDVVHPHGSHLKLEAVASGRILTKAEITLRDTAGNEEIVPIDPLKGDSSRFVFVIKELKEPFTYRFRSGDGQTSWHTVNIAERPTLKVAGMKIVPPAYSKLPEFQQQGLPKSVKALQGSRLYLLFEPSIPLQSLVLHGEDMVDHELMNAGENQYRCELELKGTYAFRPVLTSLDGLTNAQPPRCEIIVYRDQSPMVDVANPTNEIALRPDDSVTIAFDAKDDLGISKAELIIFDSSTDDHKETKTIPIPLGVQAGEKSVYAQTSLDLKEFNLKHGDQLTYAIRVYDTKNEAVLREPGSVPPVTSAEQTPNGSTLASQQSSQSNQQSIAQPKTEPEKDALAANNSSEKHSESKQDSHDSDKAPENNEQKLEQANGGLAGGNQWKPKNAVKQQKDEQPSDEITGAPRSDFFMAKHELDTPPGQSTSCSRRHIKIDEWAGSFESQVLEKLQIEIDPVLHELKKLLKQAKEALQPLAKQAKQRADWKTADGIAVRSGDDSLDQAEGHVKALTAKTDATPYAFIGLQLQDIVQLHISPARERLHDVTLFDTAAKPDDLTAAVVHIERSIELIEKLTRQFEAVKLNQKLADTMINIKKMHQMFLEGTFAMLTAQKPLLNPKERAFMELDLTDEFLAKLKEFLQKKLEIQTELAKVLSQDPRLLQRFMARSRLEATTLRDQLTVLNQRQQALVSEVKQGLPPADQPDGKLELKNHLSKRSDAAAQIFEETSKMLDDFVIWTPLDRDLNEGNLATFRAKGVKMVAVASEFAQEAKKEKGSKGSELAEALYQKLIEWEQTLPELLTENDDPKMQLHIAHRVEAAQRLITDVTGWKVKEQVIEAGDHHLAAEIDEHRITVDTVTLARKLNSLRAQCQGINVELGNTANEFLKTMEEDLIPELEKSQVKLDDNELRAAVTHQMAAVEHFNTAEKQLDDVMEGLIKHLDSMPFDEKPEFPDGLEPESLNDLLTMLEHEARAAETLGIPSGRPSNLQLEKDWSNPTSRPGGGNGQNGAPRTAPTSKQISQEKLASEHAEKIHKKMGDALKKFQEQTREQPETALTKSERKWDTLGSKLEDHLRQGRGNLPPEQYRKAIEQYFESLAGKSRKGPKVD